jgi:hypothetical protein
MQRIPARTMPTAKGAGLMVAVVLSTRARKCRQGYRRRHRCHHQRYRKHQKDALHYLSHLLFRPLLSTLVVVVVCLQSSTSRSHKVAWAWRSTRLVAGSGSIARRSGAVRISKGRTRAGDRHRCHHKNSYRKHQENALHRFTSFPSLPLTLPQNKTGHRAS